MGVRTAPLLVVFQTPPCAVPPDQIAVFFSKTPRAAVRPDMIAGPIERKWSLSNCVAVGVVPWASSWDPRTNEAAIADERASADIWPPKGAVGCSSGILTRREGGREDGPPS